MPQRLSFSSETTLYQSQREGVKSAYFTSWSRSRKYYRFRLIMLLFLDSISPVFIISEILSLNNLPDDVKNDCRNEPKAGRVILALIARQKTPEKMTALYTKYKESGLTVGELRKKASKPKQLDAPVDLTFVDQFYDRIYALDSDTLTNSQKVSLNQTIVKMRSMLLEKTHKLKEAVTVAS